MQVQSLGREDPLEEEMATHSTWPGDQACVEPTGLGGSRGRKYCSHERPLALTAPRVAAATRPLPPPSGYPPGAPNPTCSLAEPLPGQSLG